MNIIDCMDKCWTGQDPKYVHIKKDLRSNRLTECLPGHQAHLEGKDAYSKESGELEDDSAADGGVRATLSETQPEI